MTRNHYLNVMRGSLLPGHDKIYQKALQALKESRLPLEILKERSLNDNLYIYVIWYMRISLLERLWEHQDTVVSSAYQILGNVIAMITWLWPLPFDWTSLPSPHYELIKNLVTCWPLGRALSEGQSTPQN